MSNIRRRASGRNRASGLGSSSGDLEAYADYFSEYFAATRANGEEDKPYIILSEKYWLTHNTLSGIIRALPNNKAPGIDGVTAEIVKLEEKHSAMLCSHFTGPYFEADVSQKTGT